MFLILKQGSAGQKGTFFMCLKNHTLNKILYKKKLGDRFYFKDNTKFLFLIFQKINMLNKSKQNFESGLRAAVFQPLY